MSKEYKISQLIMNNENLYYNDDDELKNYKKVYDGDKTRYLTWDSVK